ncbi:hypothetical protein WR25_09370 [Diploscapter pachys]|uniref:Condensin II complex subunit H2 N-terminal domain-containing protein n=1 Tax=Diploscapter pachys TaxID=2018661 RepID=A0A2A2JKH1_9BILA|nr:hypothetical protein WR25_09370 [Diploscapter pachys]
MDDDEAVSRYAYLLQPIRDLQKNFEVNLVDILDEYLEKLKVAETTTNLDVTNGRKFDFNVASVVVRGTTMVYGKKIELVLGESRNFLEQLGSSKNAKKSMGKKSTENGDSPEDEAEQAKKRDPLHLTELKEFRKRVKDTMFLVMKEHVRFHAEPTASIPLCLEPLVDVEKTPFTLMAADGKTLIGKMEDFFVNRLKAINGALYHTTENLQWTNVISDPNPTVELDDSGKPFKISLLFFYFWA